MSKQTIIYLHGFLSSAQGTKANYLQSQLADKSDVSFHAIEFNPTARDFEFMTITGQINRLRQYLLERQLETVKLIGSSLGGQVALNYAYRYGGVDKLLLLAPALIYTLDRYNADELTRWQSTDVRHLWHDGLQGEISLRYAFHLDRLQYNQLPPSPAPTVIIHGHGDDVVPITGSQQYASANSDSVTLIEVDSDHGLSDQLPLIWEQVERFLLD